jgi:hypothetical protein
MPAEMASYKSSIAGDQQINKLVSLYFI